ncbi:hypothetical protein PO124_28135 [Bacillus licheniformis]|nr:hypothetical protein [Bacillus licheniformis]
MAERHESETAVNLYMSEKRKTRRFWIQGFIKRLKLLFKHSRRQQSPL